MTTVRFHSSKSQNKPLTTLKSFPDDYHITINLSHMTKSFIISREISSLTEGTRSVQWLLNPCTVSKCFTNRRVPSLSLTSSGRFPIRVCEEGEGRGSYTCTLRVFCNAGKVDAESAHTKMACCQHSDLKHFRLGDILPWVESFVN